MFAGISIRTPTSSIGVTLPTLPLSPRRCASRGSEIEVVPQRVASECSTEQAAELVESAQLGERLGAVPPDFAAGTVV